MCQWERQDRDLRGQGQASESARSLDSVLPSDEAPGPALDTPEMYPDLLSLSLPAPGPAGRGFLGKGASLGPRTACLAGGRRGLEPGWHHSSHLPAHAHVIESLGSASPSTLLTL